MSENVANENHEENVEPEGLSEHDKGESAGEWLKSDAEQTKEDLHIGNDDK